MIRYFQKSILDWYEKHGRKDLPWQKNITPYRVWISEIMLQQTQVNTVISYFEKFIQKFPDVQSLADAHEDEVLHLWTGLGYYARARNLHKTAKIISTHYQGKFPDNQCELENLPGIGRSTAGAILAISFKKRAAILDGNVKRVLSRVHAMPSFKNENILWQIAENYTPEKNTEKYTQAMMDLGATICTRSKPRCLICPVQKNCQAFITQRQAEFPGKKPKKVLLAKKIILLILINSQGKILLEKRPSQGIWGGLWGLPEFNALTDIQKKYGKKISACMTLDVFRHTFTHFHLDILPVKAILKKTFTVNPLTHCWYDLVKPPAVGLAAPVKKLLIMLDDRFSSRFNSVS